MLICASKRKKIIIHYSFCMRWRISRQITTLSKFLRARTPKKRWQWRVVFQKDLKDPGLFLRVFTVASLVKVCVCVKASALEDIHGISIVRGQTAGLFSPLCRNRKRSVKGRGLSRGFSLPLIQMHMNPAGFLSLSSLVLRLGFFLPLSGDSFLSPPASAARFL